MEKITENEFCKFLVQVRPTPGSGLHNYIITAEDSRTAVRVAVGKQPKNSPKSGDYWKVENVVNLSEWIINVEGEHKASDFV